RQTGGGGFAMLRGAPVVYEHQEEIRDLLIAEVRRRGVLQPADFSVQNWRLEPAAARAAAYAAMHASAFDTPGAVGAAAPAQGRRLRIIASNDFHGALEARADGNGVLRGGAPYFATAIRRAREECVPPACVSVWLDGGDEFQGTPVSNLGFGRPVVEVFSRLGLNAAALGNHEFDWGLDTLRARMREAPYPILGANVRDATGADVAWIPNDTILDVQGVRIGVVGISTVETPSATRPTIVAGLRFVDPVPVVNAHAKALRARGAQAVVVVAHAGAFCDRANADSCKGEIVRLAQGITERVDAIVSGHTHSRVATVVNGIPIVQAYSSGSAIGVIDVPLGGGTPSVTVRNVRPDSLPADSAIAALTTALLSTTAAHFREPVAVVAERMETGTRGTLGNLIADAQRWAGGGDVAIMNRGGLRAALPAGTVTRGSLFEVQPFGNALVRISLRGAELRSWLERLASRDDVNFFLSGVRVVVDSTKPAGHRIVKVTLSDGRVLDERRVYRLVMSDFLAVGGDGLNLTERAIAVEELKLVDVDVLERYLGSRPSPVRAPTDARLVPLGK
ncbi:MAG: 5'-nucleotidase C-terminal domain-containing protein, partial [Gemmatimonadaceae bacterium]